MLIGLGVLHPRYMKTQHIKFEILKERLILFYYNLIQHNFVLIMLSTDQICKENVHPLMMSLLTSLKVLMLATGKLLNQLFQNLCDFTGWMIYISGYKQNLVRFNLPCNESEKCIFSVVLSRPNFD